MEKFQFRAVLFLGLMAIPGVVSAQAKFTLTSGATHFHWVSVSPRQIRTAIIDPDDFDAVVKVWLEVSRIDSSYDAEEYTVGPGDWMLVVDSYDQRTGSYELSITGNPQPWSVTATHAGSGKNHLIRNIPSGETRRIVVSSSDFDVVLKVLQYTHQVDQYYAGTAERVVLDEPGAWHLTVEALGPSQSGAYTLTLR